MDVSFFYGTVACMVLALVSCVCGEVDYMMGPMNASWTEAKDYCTARGGLMYMQTEVGQWDDLNRSLEKQNLALKNDSYFWIGLSRASDNAEFQWADNSVFESDNWMPNEPNNATGYNCVKASSLNANWMTTMCAALHGVVCRANPQTPARLATPKPRPQAKRDNNAVMWEGLLKGFACAGGLILVVAILMHLPCCKSWVNKKETEVFKWQGEMKGRNRPNMEPVTVIGQQY
ncbi:macrophage mannose receptor 1-like [Haliotis rufescens]|uniref:macrophage mannose receptor 1-like n=1 Tax=Haliotis rufescens TaxID=6454 RepID=UPI00201EB23D|nr:macrophage mannose receptor 1-like [Haliotis rufescens]